MLGFMWVGVGTLIMLYFYTLYFVYKPKAVYEDRKEFKQVYTYMDKNARPMAILLIMYLIPTFIVVNEFPDVSLRMIGKGLVMIIVAGPFMHWHFGDKKKFKWSVR